MDPRISMITLGVGDLAAAIKFYEEGLGFPRMESPPTVAFFTLNGIWLGLYSRDSLAEDATVSAEGSGFNNFALAHNVASEEEVHQVMEQELRRVPPWLRTLRKSFGAATRVTSKTWTDTYGKWPITPSFGSGLSRVRPPLVLPT